MMPETPAEDAHDLLGFVDVLHGFDDQSCAAGLMVLDHRSEPVEFVFNRVAPGCRHLHLKSLWPAPGPSRAESRDLLASLLTACRSRLSALIGLEERVDVRLLAIDLKVPIPAAVLRSDSIDVLRWIPGHPPEQLRAAVDGLGALAPLSEAIGRVGKGLAEAYGSTATET